MNNETDPLETLYWIDLPADIDTDMGAFTLDPAIPLPIESTEGETPDISSITWEKVTAAMLLVLANSPGHEHAAYYRKFLGALRPSLMEELKEAARESSGTGDWDRAEDILLALRGLAPEHPDARFALAGFYARRWEHEQKTGDARKAEAYASSAEAAYGELLSDASAPQDAWFQAGTFRYRRGRFLQAAETLESYLQAADEGPDKQEAQRLIRLCRDEGQSDTLYMEAYAALTENRVGEGIDMAREFLQERPKSWPAWFLLGWGLRLAENWSEAREALEKAREHGCRESNLYNELAICTRAQGDFDASASALEHALRTDPENIKILSNMAIVQMEKGDTAEAVRWLRTALTLEPGDPICTKLLEELGESA